MFSFLNVPAKILSILEANITPQEIAFGVCLGMFLGFTPLNGTTAILLALFFFIFKINRMATLLTLPIFKALYLAGVSSLGDASGAYLLEKADYLTGFWRLVTHLPVIAYLDLNRTTVAGGLLLSAILSVPVFFIVKGVSAPLLAKYSSKMQNTAFSKWINRFKLVTKASNVIGPDIAATVGNVKASVKQTVISKIKSTIIKPKPPKTTTGILKRLNVGGIAVIVAALVVIQVGVGLIISPLVSAFIIDSLNKSGAARVTVERINVWPLTLSFSMKELKIFDPNASDERILRVGVAHIRISPLALLSKKLIISSAHMENTELDLKGLSDGTYNIQHLALIKPTDKKTQKMPDVVSLWQGMTEKKDLFGKIYGQIKNNFSGKGQEKAKEAHKSAKQVTKVVQELPQGKLVSFTIPSDMYLFEIKNLALSGKLSVTPYNAQPVELSNMRIALKRVALDPQNGARVDGMHIKGAVVKGGSESGSLDVLFSKSYANNMQSALAKVELKNIDLDSVRFVYEDSLPVHIVRGRISLSSVTNIVGETIDSRNSMTLTGQALAPKQGGVGVVGFIPIANVCDALNGIDPVRLKFDITGTVEKPQFGGFQDMLLDLIKPYVANISEQVKTQGINALGKLFQKNAGGGSASSASTSGAGTNDNVQQAVKSLGSLFGKKEN